VLGQLYKKIEYIIIDGNSSDKTNEIISKYRDNLAFYLSEPDKGLYDAMNKGLAKATGDYVCFLNSGDQFYSSDTIGKVFSTLPTETDIIYGETMIVDAEGNEIGLRRLKAPKKLTWKSFKKGMLVCHQSVYVKRSIAPVYDLQYKIASDFDWVLKSLRAANKIHNTKLILTRFLDGGLNKKNIPIALRERFRIMSHNYGFIPTAIRHVPIGLKFLLYLFKNKRF
jgi:glycosyltransferase involved in cell wall biosynthesis